MLLAIVIVLTVLFGAIAFIGAPYVPSLRREVRESFNSLYPIKSGDVVVDLGSGDGAVLKVAIENGARGVGYELNPLLAAVSKLRLRNAASIHVANMWTARLPDDTTLVYAFTVTRDTKKLSALVEREANRLGRSLNVMTFGAELYGHTPLRTRKAHALYEITPNSR